MYLSISSMLHPNVPVFSIFSIQNPLAEPIEMLIAKSSFSSTTDLHLLKEINGIPDLFSPFTEIAVQRSRAAIQQKRNCS